MCVVGLHGRVTKLRDIPIQKSIGIVTETFNTFTLLLALLEFKQSCLSKLDAALTQPGVKGSAWIGPGYYCYLVCVLSGVIRAVIHFIVPLPGKSCDVLNLCVCLEKERIPFKYHAEHLEKLPADVKTRFEADGWHGRFNNSRSALTNGGGVAGGEDEGGSRVEVQGKSLDMESSQVQALAK
jgi:hypothetical protein